MTALTRLDANPKDAVGSRKARWFSYLPLQALVGVGLAMLEGARKYGRHNYRVAPVRASAYVDAVVCGHLAMWQEGEDIDPDSGANHIDKAIASLLVLRDAMIQGTWIDDRPPAGNVALMRDADKKAAAIIDRYPDAEEPFTEVARAAGAYEPKPKPKP